MAYLLDVTKVQEITIKARQENCDVQTVFHVASSLLAWTDPPTVSSNTMLTSVWNQYTGGLRLLQSTNLAFLSIASKQITGWAVTPGIPPGRKPIYNAQDELSLVGQAGGAAGNVLPTFVAVTGRKNTALPGRKWRGRIHFGGVVEADTEGNQGNFLTAIALPIWQGAWDAFRGTLFQSGANANDDVQLGVFSLLFLSQTVPANQIADTRNAWQPTTSGPINGYVGSQLSRKFRQPG